MTIQAISVVGRMKTGKTTLALSAPKPLVVFDFELGVDRVEPKYVKDRDQIKVVPYVGEMMALRKREVAAIQKVKSIVSTQELEDDTARGFWKKILVGFNAALEDKAVKSIIFDTFSSVWEARRLAFLEELQEIDPSRKSLTPPEYFIPNTDMRMLITQALLQGKTLILVHHTRPKYTEGKETSEEVPDGFKYTGDLVEVEFWTNKRKDTHGVMKPYGTIKACRLCMAVEGQELAEPTYDLIDKLITARRGLATV